MAPRFFLRLLGEPELQSPDGERVRLRVRKHLALLAYFATHRGQVHRRDRLAEFLWPEASPAEGRHSVAVALSAIRGKLGLRTFECTRDTVRFLAPNLDVDLDRLAKGDVLDGDLTPALAVDAFLGDFEVGRAPEFMLWRDQMQARWLPQIQNALVILMDRCRRTGDFSGIEVHADRLLALDEYSEQAVRAKMEARTFTGDRVAAIRIYEEWRGRLAADLDTAPSALMEGMALRLRQRGFEAPGSVRMPTVLTQQWRHQAFIGRGPQYRTLYESWEHTKHGAGRHSLLLGESGVGKSTLAQRIVTAASLEGAISSRVQCYEVEREIPYAAVGTLVGGLLDQPGAGGTPPEWLGELARTVAAVRERFPGLPAPSAAEGETVRIRLMEAVLQLALAVAEEHPVILVVDDVHIADDASVAVLHLLMRRTRGQRIMVLMTARREELDRSPHASRLLESREHLGLQMLDLPPFTNDEMQELVTALGQADGRPVPPTLRRALIHATAGIPMVAELLHDDWRRRGPECLALSLGAMTSELTGSTAEEVYRRLFHRVFDTLSPDAQAVLNLAAILGERLNDHALYDLVDLSIGQCLAGMIELAQRRLFVDDGHKLQFRNELIRGYAYLAIPSPLRRVLHGLVADWLLQASARGEAIPGLTLAWHCFRGGRAVEAVPHLLAGAREAIDHGAPHEAELGLSSATASLPAEAGAEASLLLAESLQEQGRWEESIAILEERDHRSEGWDQRREVLCLYAKATLPRSEEEARRTLYRLQALSTAGVPESARSLVLEGLERSATYLNDTEAASQAMSWALKILASPDALSDRVRSAISLVVLTWMTRSKASRPDVLRTLGQLTEEATGGGL
jgi:DNA-binding SARP family transcriptional activator